MDLKDWMGVADQFNQISARRDGQARTQAALQSYDLQNQKAARDELIARQTAELTNKLAGAETGPPLSEAVQAGQPAVKTGLGQAIVESPIGAASPAAAPAEAAPAQPAGIDYSQYEPEAAAAARLNHLQYQASQRLNDKAYQEKLKADAEADSNAYVRGLAQALSLKDQGDEMGAKLAYADNYRNFKNGVTASVDEETGDMLLTLPNGQSRRIKDFDIEKAVDSDMKVLDPAMFVKGRLTFESERAKVNQKALTDGLVTLFDPRTGEAKAYQATLMDKDGTWRTMITDRPPHYPGAVEVSGKGLAPKAVIDVQSKFLDRSDKRDKEAAGDTEKLDKKQSETLKSAMGEIDKWAKNNNSEQVDGPFGTSTKINPQYSEDKRLASAMASQLLKQTGGEMDPALLFAQSTQLVSDAKEMAKNQYAAEAKKAAADPKRLEALGTEAAFVKWRAAQIADEGLRNLSAAGFDAAKAGRNIKDQAQYENRMNSGMTGTVYNDASEVDLSQFKPGVRYQIEVEGGQTLDAMMVDGRLVGTDGKPIDLNRLGSAQ